jgi:hypothetical protein
VLTSSRWSLNHRQLNTASAATHSCKEEFQQNQPVSRSVTCTPCSSSAGHREEVQCFWLSSAHMLPEEKPASQNRTCPKPALAWCGSTNLCVAGLAGSCAAGLPGHVLQQASQQQHLQACQHSTCTAQHHDAASATRVEPTQERLLIIVCLGKCTNATDSVTSKQPIKRSTSGAALPSRQVVLKHEHPAKSCWANTTPYR